MRAALQMAIFLLGALLPLCMANYPCYPPFKPPCVKPYIPKTKPCPPKKLPPYKPPAITCPIEQPRISACINLLGDIGGLVHIVIGEGILGQCCPLFNGLTPEVASTCLCGCIKNSYANPGSLLPAIGGLLGGCGLPAVNIPCL